MQVLKQVLALLTQPQDNTPPLLRQRVISTKTASGYNNTYSVYSPHPSSSQRTNTLLNQLLQQDASPVPAPAPPAGRGGMPTTVTSSLIPVLLAVPEAVRELEAKQQAARVELLQEFESLVQSSSYCHQQQQDQHQHQHQYQVSNGSAAVVTKSAHITCSTCNVSMVSYHIT